MKIKLKSIPLKSFNNTFLRLQNDYYLPPRSVWSRVPPPHSTKKSHSTGRWKVCGSAILIFWVVLVLVIVFAIGGLAFWMTCEFTAFKISATKPHLANIRTLALLISVKLCIMHEFINNRQRKYSSTSQDSSNFYSCDLFILLQQFERTRRMVRTTKEQRKRKLKENQKSNLKI